MNNEIFKLFGTIGVDTSQADKAIDNTVDNAEKEVEKIPGFFKKAAQIIGTVFVVDKLIDFGKASVDAAAEAMAIQAQFEQVFGNTQGLAKSTLDQMAKDFGMLPNRLKGPLTTTTSMFKGLGLDTEDAMAQAGIAVTLAADAAAFFDRSYEDANRALNSFIKGNYAGGESIGLFANETQLATWASQNLGIEWSKLGEADKQMARLQFATAMQESAGATGQASRESEAYQNQVGNLKQAWNDFKVVVGTPMMDTVIQGLMTAVEWIQKASAGLQDFINWANENETAMILMGVALGTIVTLLTAYQIQQHGATIAATAWKFISGIAATTTTALGTAFAFLTSPIGLIILAIGAAIAIGVLLWKNWDTIKEKVGQLWTNNKEKFKQIGDAIMAPVEKAKNFVKDMIDKIKGFFNFKWSLPKLKLPKVKIDGEFSLLPPKVPKFSIDWFAKGGIMTGPTIFGMNGGNLMGGGEAGREAVLPLNRDTLGSIGEGIVNASDMNNPGFLEKLDAIIDLLVELLTVNPQYQVLLDSGALVGELTPLIDERMGRRAERKMRGG